MISQNPSVSQVLQIAASFPELPLFQMCEYRARINSNLVAFCLTERYGARAVPTPWGNDAGGMG